jgi:hypothetical protein
VGAAGASGGRISINGERSDDGSDDGAAAAAAAAAEADDDARNAAMAFGSASGTRRLTGVFGSRTLDSKPPRAASVRWASLSPRKAVKGAQGNAGTVLAVLTLRR